VRCFSPISWPVFLVGLCVALGLGCSKPAPETDPGRLMSPVEPGHAEFLEPSLAALIGQHVEAVRQAPGDASAHARLGMVYEANNLWHQAAESYRNASQLDPAEPMWSYRAAVALRHRGSFEEALERLRELVSRTPHNSLFQLRLGQWLLDAGELDAAEACFARVAGMEPSSALGHSGLADAQLRRGNARGAVSHLRQALALEPKDKQSNYMMGQALFELGREEEALPYLRSGLNRYQRSLPDPLAEQLDAYCVNVPVLIQRALALNHGGKYEEAVGLYQRCQELRPGDPEVLNGLAFSLMNAERFDEALQTLEGVLARGAGELEATTYNNLAACLMNMGRLEEAHQHARRAVELNPADFAASFTLAGICGELERWEEAKQFFGRAFELSPESHQARVGLALACFRLGDHEQARVHYEEIIASEPEFMQAHLGLAEIAIALGNLEQAERELGIARSISPRNRKVAETAALLERARNP
jgi:tetratricopeptide (TPR) repeat protein